MSFTASRKIKKDIKDVTPLEKRVAEVFLDLEQKDAIGEEAKLFYINSVREIALDGKKAAVVYVPYPLLKAFQKQPDIVRTLEKKISGVTFVVVGDRTIMKKQLRCNPLMKERRPRNRTLTAVHDAILSDIVSPVHIIGKRTQHKVGASARLQVVLPTSAKTDIDNRLSTLSKVYGALTGKHTEFIYM